MVSKKKKSDDMSPNFFAGVPLGQALNVAEGVGGLAMKYISQKYEIEKKIDEIKSDTTEKVEEIREEAIKSGYAVKKAFLTAIVEGLLLVTGLLSLIYGLILVIGDKFGTENVLIAYGVITLAYVVFTMKTAPDKS